MRAKLGTEQSPMGLFVEVSLRKGERSREVREVVGEAKYLSGPFSPGGLRGVGPHPWGWFRRGQAGLRGNYLRALRATDGTGRGLGQMTLELGCPCRDWLKFWGMD